MFELHVTKYPVRDVNFTWHLQNSLEKHVMLKGEERRVTTITEPKYFTELAASIGSAPYMLLPTQLIKRRFLGPVLQYDVDQYKAENSADENVIFIEDPLPGIAIVREILTVTREFELLHEAVAVSEPDDLNSYNVSFEPIPCRSKLDCPIHFSDVRILPESVILRIGASIYDPEVIEANKKYAARRKRVKSVAEQLEELQASLIVNAVATASMTLTDDPMRNPNYEEELEMAESLLQKVFEWLAKKQKKEQKEQHQKQQSAEHQRDQN
jgi:hypothetical protein